MQQPVSSLPPPTHTPSQEAVYQISTPPAPTAESRALRKHHWAWLDSLWGQGHRDTSGLGAGSHPVLFPSLVGGGGTVVCPLTTCQPEVMDQHGTWGQTVVALSPDELCDLGQATWALQGSVPSAGEWFDATVLTGCLGH